MVNAHFSTSSSVYSPIESEYRFQAHTSSHPIIEETDEEHELGSDSASIHTSSDLNDATRRQSVEVFGSDYVDSDASIHSSSQMPEYSAQTFNSYVTASGSNPSFTSINNSLLKTLSLDGANYDSYRQTADNDETPRLDSSAMYHHDPIDSTPLIGSFPTDNTPIILSAGYREDTVEPLSPEGIVEDLSLAVPELALKFQRLSMTLQQSGPNVSQESYDFQTSFQLNVKRANSVKQPLASRTSVYYRKIHTKPSEDDTQGSIGGDSRSVTPRDDNSVVSGASVESYHHLRSRQGTSIGDISDETVTQRLLRRNDLFKTSNTLPQSIDGGLKISFSDTTENPANGISEDNSHTLATDDSRYSMALSTDSDAEDMSVLFIRALHSFDSTESQSESDNSVCLSFEKGEIAFVHTIDDSGWGEVTLVDSLERGWIPMNYFALAIATSANSSDDDNTLVLHYSRYMRPLLHACGKFLLNPLSHTTREGTITFSIRTVNAVRDGVRMLLQETDCLSRSNEIVIKKPVVRKARKSLLSDWYTLMVRANEYKGTQNFEKIEILQLLILQVIRRAATFFEIWAGESSEIIKRATEVKLQNDMNSFPLLEAPPLAKMRVTEINGALYSYLSLIIGRLDLIEHNPIGCDLLETITHHIILLLRELLFVSKTGSDFSLEKPADLDGSLDSLLSLVSELVTVVKSLVISTVSEGDRSINKRDAQQSGGYTYTEEGQNLLVVASKMIKTTGATVASIRKLFESIGDFKLSSERSYPNYAEMRIEPEEFIRKCSVGMVKSHSLKNHDLRTMKLNNPAKSNRYSMFRSGKSGDLGITANGVNHIHKFMIVDSEESSVPFSLEFLDYMSNPDEKVENETYTIRDELLIDASGNLLGASFKGLVYTLTNETSPPEYFFVSTFFICFRSFGSGLDLTELLISRFDSANEEDKGIANNDPLWGMKLKSRRRLVCKMFQIWMESHWTPVNDMHLLSTLVNFFNEGVYKHLPIEAMKLIEIAASLLTRNPTQSKDQLVFRNITLAKIQRKDSFLSKRSSDASLSSRYSMVDGYELSRINTNSSVASSLKSITLPMPLGINGLTNSTSLLTKSQIATIESVVVTYRAILGNYWCPQAYIDTRKFIPLFLLQVLPRWIILCEQSWVLSNYRPNLLDFNGLELARQLTLIESEIFCAIKPEELLNGNFTSKKAHLKLAPNVRLSLLFTNCLSDYVLESVLQPGITQKLRVNTVKTWLKVAISCLYLRNFNSLAAIITSLQSHLITRLTKVWTDLSEKYTELYEYLSSIVHPEKNYSVYRAKLKSFLLSNDYNIPVVPYFSLFLQDLTFVTEGNPNFRKANTFLNQKLINIDKYLKITRIIADIESLQIPYTSPSAEKKRSSNLFSKNNGATSNDEYSIAPVASLQELILLELWKISELNRKEEDRAWKLSCLIQPRDTPQVNAYHNE